ncbi:glycosyltransferase family 2 protein [Azospirillum picis]|uniref:Glycosyltransferase involved in cell wall biosynthesis n=1 Tax=Azospirillum picis TaxID=488438 RepID=A0ABU0MU90_9PROT|nr:glycosyltransferase [Azospirillum picis]MBP2303202.1 glycosyltransferase involved in cell wall biosynthesis [Azospirillum picis]MDQ0536991.1 glycosyltransferase involved in cell wall biosynthesis [Azospirillum picis]
MPESKPTATVTIVTRTKNRPQFLPRARASVEAQNFRDLVWVVVNDAGDPAVPEREVKAAQRNGLRALLVNREASIGMEAASNDGINRVDSRYIVIHDDDDSWDPAFLEKTVHFLDNNPHPLGVVTYSARIIEDISSGEPVTVSIDSYNDKLRAIYLSDLCEHNRFPPISFLFRRRAYEALGGFDESLPVLGDWDFNLRILLQGEIALLPETLANYHLRLAVPDGQGHLGNTVTTGLSQHAVIDCRYRNHILREDVKAGRIGLGMLLAMGRNLAHTTSRISQRIDTLETAISSHPED